MDPRAVGPPCSHEALGPHTRAAPAPTRGAVSKKCVAERSSSAVCEAERGWGGKAVGSADLSELFFLPPAMLKENPPGSATL